LLERGRARAAAEDLDIIFQEADAEALPFGDDSFDFVLSVIGAMFAPDQEAVARELSRVCRPGGTIGLLNWTATGFLADLFRLIAARVPPPEGVRPPASWGSEERVRELLTPYTDEIVCTPGRLPHHFASGRAYADFMITNYGPTLKAAESLSAQDASAFAEDITRLAEQHNRATDGSLTFDSDYLVVQARVRS
jgi:ubiquinone/menaquinone biosynthesis C-methylase UbiE